MKFLVALLAIVGLALGHDGQWHGEGLAESQDWGRWNNWGWAGNWGGAWGAPLPYAAGWAHGAWAHNNPLWAVGSLPAAHLHNNPLWNVHALPH